ncbi:MAG: amidohydrolase family protein [Ignavibacteriales bacterium]|nr:amidohydrolase family protein [Ignavibacteriales bacterium]MCF8306620.1 amidohydrolase family protein [Ignavibacteriales bacterium]MCF8316280.1 amidohydrolase family protein [Ignavibacteriales bacterium]MCF8437864.1 amidohydrolase family protein [Ignavibacteriales bacterium]
MDKTLKILNTWICEIQNDRIIPVFGDIIITSGKISGIIPKDFSAYNFRTSESTEPGSIDAGGRVSTVPLVNFHDHFYSRLAKGLPSKGSMSNFPEILKNLWWKLDLLMDADITEASAQMAALESVRCGVTYIFDHHSSPRFSAGSLGKIADILKKSGLRGVLCFETTDRNGKDLSAKGIAENIDFLHNLADDNIRGMFGLHASFTIDDATLEAAGRLLQETGFGVHVHLCEDVSDRRESQRLYGSSPVERLNRFGLINSKTILAHGIHLTGNDFAKITNNGAAIAVNLDSNMNNAVGITQFPIFPSDIPLLTGTDGMNSNPARTLKQAFLFARHSGMTFSEAFSLIKKIYFDQITFVRRYFPDYPGLVSGDRADFIIWDYIPPTPFREDNFWGHYIYGMLDRTIHSVVQNGSILMDNFRINIDEKPIQENILKQGKKLFGKMAELN